MKLLKDLLTKITEVRVALKHPGKGASITYIKYPPDCTFNGLKVLNVGCGHTVYKIPNVTNVDLFPVDGVNVAWDLSKVPLPFEDNSYDLIIANHILEHVPNWFECFKELARIVKVSGVIEVWLPGPGDSQLGYRDHINVINHCSFYGIKGTMRNYCNAWEEQQRNSLGDVKHLKLEVHQRVLYNMWWMAIMPKSIQTWMGDHLVNAVTELGFKFRKTSTEFIK